MTCCQFGPHEQTSLKLRLKYTHRCFQQNAFVNYAYKMSSIIFRPQRYNRYWGCYLLTSLRTPRDCCILKGPVLQTWFNFNLGIDTHERNHMSSKVLDEITGHSKLQRLTMLVKGASDVNLCSLIRHCPRIAEILRTTGISMCDLTALIDKAYHVAPTMPCDVIAATSWAWRRFKSPATWVSGPQFIQVSNKKNIKVLHFPLRAVISLTHATFAIHWKYLEPWSKMSTHSNPPNPVPQTNGPCTRGKAAGMDLNFFSGAAASLSYKQMS